MNKTILLVGETGTGKSTLINALVNYAMGVEFDDNDWYQMVEEEKKSQTESQTSDVIVYEVFGLEDRTLPFSLTIIDTPGFGDTRGYERDVLISERLLDLFRSTDGVHKIDAVCLVLKASDCRLSDRLMYIFNSVVSLFGKDIKENTVALITYSDFVTPENVLQALKDENICLAKDELGEPVHFMFNNRQQRERNKRNEHALKNSWESTEEQIDLFADFLKNTKSQNLKETVKGTVEVLKACIDNLQERVQFIELKQREIQQTQEGVKKHEQDMKNNKEFTIEVDEVYKCKEPVECKKLWWMLWENNAGATCCTVCKETCHYPCEIARGPHKCDVMQGDKNELFCTVCTGNCHVDKHVKAGWKYVSQTRKVKKTEKEIKKKYQKGKEDIVKSASLLETLLKNIEDLPKEKEQFLEEYFHVVELEEIAMKEVSLAIQVHLDFLIEREKGETKKVIILKMMKSQMDENPRFKSALSYVSGKTAAFGQATMDLFRANTAE